MSSKDSHMKLAAVKEALALKYERLARLASSVVKQKKYQNQAARFRRQAADLRQR